MVLTAALLTRLQGSGVELDLGQQVVDMVRSLYRTKHKLPAQVRETNSFLVFPHLSPVMTRMMFQVLKNQLVCSLTFQLGFVCDVFLQIHVTAAQTDFPPVVKVSRV